MEPAALVPEDHANKSGVPVPENGSRVIKNEGPHNESGNAINQSEDLDKESGRPMIESEGLRRETGNAVNESGDAMNRSGTLVIESANLRNESGDAINRSGDPVNESRDPINENGTKERLTKPGPTGRQSPAQG